MDEPIILRHKVDELMRYAAAKAVIPRFRNLSESEVRTKSGPKDLVTAADEEAEQLLHEGLLKILPDSLVIGEEAAAADPFILSHLTHHEPVWVIDPIDGTANFVAGDPKFAIVIAMVDKRHAVFAWIHDPIKSRTLWAAQGGGTWIEDKRLKVSVPHTQDFGAMSASMYHRAFKDSRNRFGKTRRCGSAAHEYWALVENHLQVSSFSRLKPWDHAAGVLIHSEAGGYTRMLDGLSYDPANAEKRGLLSAPSKEIWTQIRTLADEEYV